MKLGLIYYKNLVDAAFEKMFASIGSMFAKSDDETYVFAGGWSKKRMSKLFEQCLREAVSEVIVPSTQTYDKYIMIGSCWPKDNLLLKFKDSTYFPKKLDALLEKKPEIKYLMRERDICLDIAMMNDVFVSTFSAMFNKGASKVLGEEFSNVIVLSHSHLDCYALFKTVKWAYGSSSCINVWKEKMSMQM